MLEIVFRVAAAAAILGLAVLAYRYDRLRGRNEIQRYFLEAHLVKALRDRRHMVRIPAAVLKAAFQLHTRALPDPAQWNAKPGQHPATERKVRRAAPGA
jgi:hypothetical protein